MTWDNQTYNNWSIKMENADKGLILASDKEATQYNKDNPIPSEEEINKIVNKILNNLI